MILSFVLVFSTLSFGVSETSVKAAEEHNEFVRASQTQFDLSLLKRQEQKIYNENGEYVGTLGIEPVLSAESNDKMMSALASYKIGTGNSTWKIYWYSGTVNYHFYVDINIGSTGLATITRAYNGWYFITPPYTVKKDWVSILRKTETYTLPAEARYHLTLNSIWGGEWTIYLYARVKDQTLYTGTN